MKHIIRIFLLVFVIIVTSCEKKVWDNPFDKAAPKSIFTPSNLYATQVGATISLSWMETNNLISGYIIERQVDNGAFQNMANLPKGMVQYVDLSAISGKLHLYRLTAFADNNFSNPISASITPASAPKIVRIGLISKTFSSANFTSTFTDEGSPITSKGVCYSTSRNPTVSNSKTIDGVGSAAYISNISNLSSNVTYYVRSYATNALGTSYGFEFSVILVLNVAGPTATDGSGNVYNSVQIGDQTWTSKNLIATNYQNGQTIPIVTDTQNWSNLISGAYCDFFNRDDLGKIYGHLYNYYTVVDSRNICPTGWHVPTKLEWDELIAYLDGNTSAAIKLKEKGNLYWINANGDNSSGFSARAGSWRSQEGFFYYSVQTGGAYFWSTTKLDAKYPWLFSINSETTAKTSTDWYFQSAAGTSIRCLKN